MTGGNNMIQFDSKMKAFHLSNNWLSYVIQIEEGGVLAHTYFGKKIRHYNGNFQYPRVNRSFSPNLPGSSDRLFSLDTALTEYPGYGNGDFRTPAFVIRHHDGSRVSDFRYLSHEIRAGKPALLHLPQTYVEHEEEAETLVITLQDAPSKLTLELYYTIYEKRRVITRRSVIKNTGDNTCFVEKMASVAVDFPRTNFELIQLPGSWARERELVREPVTTGTKLLDSKRGASSHQQNPAIVLATPNTDENQGEAYGFCLVYSGNHETTIQKDQFEQTRVVMGINSFDFSWKLAAGEDFSTPEAILVYADQGLNQLSETFHALINERLVRGRYKEQTRPVVINNWEGTYFDFNEKKLLAMAKSAKELGAELFVLDDGWFGHRDHDDSSLGDWFEYAGKLKGGLRQLSEDIHELGLLFGLWFEPEMISYDSELYRAHPDWLLHVPNRAPAPGRSQYLLDFSRKDVRDNVYEQLQRVLSNVEIDYVKWDMNRHMTDVYSALLAPDQQGEVAHRYILGLYEFLEKLTTAFPDILFESCSGGGGRFDCGMLYYMPQVWTSDNTDAVSRLKIQYGTSLFYPPSTMGAHVAAIPNHQTGRKTSFAMRGNVALSGLLGYELDVTLLSADERAEVMRQIRFYKRYRELIQWGHFYRLVSPFEGNETAWMFVNDEQNVALVFYARTLAVASAPSAVLRLCGLDCEREYRVNGQILGGDELMNLGLYVGTDFEGDFASELILVEEV
jgi:alpha-galactosidase